KTILEDVPAPLVRKGHILVQTTHSLVSLGTERMLVEFGKSNLISKARQQPEKVKMVLDKVKSDGILPTLEAVFNKLEQPIPLGYCNVGKVIEVGEGVSEFAIGDRVASNGPHAEFVCVPLNLAVQIPDNVTNEEACFTVIGSIGLQGIRLLNPGFGETIVVSGLGLIGILSAELLFANGCRVIGFDMDQAKVNLAREKGIEAICLTPEMDPVRLVENMTRGIGADGVLITASTKDSTLVSQAARMSRKRGRIVLVGVTGLELNRSEFYEKELTFQVSCSYGPGRYDENYENRGQDYPLPFVRWTEKRNFEAILSAIGRGVLKVKPLISEMVELENYLEIYGNIGEKRTL
ncbi:MAG TPA: zinc-binding alcohol dehydrogenase, partial [Catalimonadaceae bacterium]|nr:zinc-binding alcohol dehydrogenase [Catalimonadaceae bacterium]